MGNNAATEKRSGAEEEEEEEEEEGLFVNDEDDDAGTAATPAPPNAGKAKAVAATAPQRPTATLELRKDTIIASAKKTRPQQAAGALDLSKLVKAKAAEKKTAKKVGDEKKQEKTTEKPAAKVQEEQPEEMLDDLPRGFDGAVWQALADAIVREDRDMRSARCGAVQQGERCSQTGPWRAEPSGRVRMSVRGPRGVEGWVTLDARRCKNAEGDFGILYLSLMPGQEEDDDTGSAQVQAASSIQMVEGAASRKPLTLPTVAYQSDFEQILAIFGHEGPLNNSTGDAQGHDEEQEAVEEEVEEERDEEGEEEEEEEEEQEVGAEVAAEPQATVKTALGEPPGSSLHQRHCVATQEGSFVQQKKSDATQEAPAKTAPEELTESERRLRNLRKKLKELDGLEARAQAGEELSEAQAAKLARKVDMVKEEQDAAAEVAREQKAAAAAVAKASSSKARRRKGGGSVDGTGGGAGRKKATVAPRQQQGASGNLGSQLVTVVAVVLLVFFAASWLRG